MKEKGNRIRKLISIICMILVFTLAVPCVAEAAPAASWSVVWDKGYAKWYCAGRKGYFHIKDNTVYQHVNGKDKKIVSLDSNKGYMEISHGRGDWLYIRQSNVLYGYNLKTGKKKVVIRKYYPVGLNVDGCGPYVYSRATDAGTYNEAYVWKLSGGTAKRVGLLGKHVKSTYVVGKNVFIEVFPYGDSLTKMELYKCNPNGKGKKQEFSLELKNGRIFPEGHSDTSFEIYADDFDKKATTHYSYDIKTGKLNIVSVMDF